MDMKEFKIRCSAIGQIMTNSRSKTEPLSKTTQTYMQDWMKEQIYGGKKFTGNKYTEKGLQVEDEAISYFECEMGFDFLIKNTQSFENNFLTGTPDLIVGDKIIDIKSSWDHWTFPLFEDKLPTKDYYWQLQGYMALTGAKTATVAYVLMDTPDELLNQWTDVPYEYEDLDSKYRIKTFDFDRNDEDIEKIYERVEECREYIKTLNSKVNEITSIRF
jgi:hypothetical protein